MEIYYIEKVDEGLHKIGKITKDKQLTDPKN